MPHYRNICPELQDWKGNVSERNYVMSSMFEGLWEVSEDFNVTRFLSEKKKSQKNSSYGRFL